MYRISIFRVRPKLGLPDFFIESGWILPDSPAIAGFFFNNYFILHPRKYEARENEKETALNISNSLLCSDGVIICISDLYFQMVLI